MHPAGIFASGMRSHLGQLGANMGPLMYRRWSVTMHAVPCLLSLCSAVTEPVLESLCGAGYRAC
eukprot:1152450-Pelagomonas_calceolata.AAC.4